MPTEPLFQDDSYSQDCTAAVLNIVDEGIVLDRTVAYAAGGGQPGDRGTLLIDGRVIPFTGTIKGAEPGSIVHVLDPGVTDAFAAGAEVTIAIDWPRRYRLMRMHTALHLLCAAVPGAVTGGQIGDGKGRLDFDLAEGALDKDALAATLNEWVRADHPVTTSWIDDAEFDNRPDLVRTLSVRPPRGSGRVRLVEIRSVDLQACGGTHVRSTAEVGALAIAKIENKGKRNRRVNLAFAEG
ncbi:alanyl-tRNA editing protein [Marinivivus vitaminiproducens]|uniref:alanyl-tRNA editing protein n=1 Tax=Marinivivus vitaminiproducens TaxID=3035935 RepID=UPI0027992426|nr:alanyl-tRNA editing protein [Geminicoccaceae bacterium SCSIO 64248]